MTVLSPGCASAPRGTPLPEIAAAINTELAPDIGGIGYGDLLEVVFPRAPEWTHGVRVGLDGKASFLGIEEAIHVRGKAVEDLRNQLERKYSEFLSKPRIGLLVREVGARSLFVIGDVNRPGVVDMEDPRITLLEAIARAGGPRKDTCDLKRVVLVRWSDESQRQLRWRIDARYHYWGVGSPVQLQPRDLVFVPNRAIDEVDIWINNWIRRVLPFPVPIPVL